MTSALYQFPNSVNQHVLFPKVYDGLCPLCIEMVDDVGAHVENRAVMGCVEMQILVTRQLLVESKDAIMLSIFLVRKRDLYGTVYGNLFRSIQQTLRRKDVLVISHVLDCDRPSCLVGDCPVRTDKSRYKTYKLTSSPAWYASREGTIMWDGGCEGNLHISV